MTLVGPSITGGSSTGVTLTMTGSLPVFVPCRASTVTRYTLTPLASAGISKSGGDLKLRAPAVIVKSPLSVPSSAHVIGVVVSPSGSSAV